MYIYNNVAIATASYTVCTKLHLLHKQLQVYMAEEASLDKYIMISNVLVSTNHHLLVTAQIYTIS